MRFLPVSSRVQAVNRVIKAHDPALYAKKVNGVIHIFEMRYGKSSHVFSLTDNWSVTGSPVEWGLDKILYRLQEHDCANQDILRRLYEEDEKVKESRERHLRSEAEAFASEIRPAFAKATEGINTSTLDKIDKRRIQDGSCK